MNIKSTCVQSCSTLCDPMDYSPPGLSVHGIFQKRILEWVAISFFRGSSHTRDWTCVFCIFCIGRSILYHWATMEAKYQGSYVNYGFIATDDTHSPNQLCVICGSHLPNKDMTPSKLLHHMKTKHFALKDKPLEFFKMKNKQTTTTTKPMNMKNKLHQIYLCWRHHSWGSAHCQSQEAVYSCWRVDPTCC